MTVLDCINPIKMVVLLTFIFALFRLQWKKPNNRYVLIILGISLILETVNSLLTVQQIKINISMTIGSIFHNSFWLALLARNCSFKKSLNIAIGLFILFSIINVLAIEGPSTFNCYTFVVSAFLYLVFFIIDSFYRLNKEEFSFFLSNDFLLLLAPILFFLGLSFMFGFKSKLLTSTMLFADVKLYTAIIYFVNLIYYSLITIYIYREKNHAHV